MLAFAWPRWTRMSIAALAALVCAAAAPSVAGSAVRAPSGNAEASQAGQLLLERFRERLGVRLLKRDPGARLGASTQVATDPGEVVHGVPGRTNFIMALGSKQQLLGGKKHDQLGVYRAAVAPASRVQR